MYLSVVTPVMETIEIVAPRVMKFAGGFFATSLVHRFFTTFARMNILDLQKSLQPLPKPERGEERLKALSALDLSSAQREDLKALARDQNPGKLPADDLDYVSIHAWRALAMRGNPADLDFFVSLLSFWEGGHLEHDLWADFSWIIRQLGQEAIQPAIDVIADESIQEASRNIIVECLEKVALEGLEASTIWEGFQKQLSQVRSERSLNGFLICALLKGRPKESCDVILAAYAANVVDVTVGGDREEIEIELGLREKRDTEIEDLFDLEQQLVLQYRREELGDCPGHEDPFRVLDYYLRLYGEDDAMKSISTLDGFLAAIIASPSQVQPHDFIPWIWDSEGGRGHQQAQFEKTAESDFFTSALMDYYNDVLEKINGVKYCPVLAFYDDDNSEKPFATPFPWALGVLAAAACLDKLRGPSSYSQKLKESVDQILITNVRDENLTEIQALDLCKDSASVIILSAKGQLGNAPDTPYTAVIEQVTRETPKVGRNDSCLCGSGKKYKKCCAI